jgi:hypothetical protein
MHIRRRKMKITDIINSNKPSLSLEVFQPKTSDSYESVKAATEEIAMLLCARLAADEPDKLCARYKLNEDEIDGLDGYDLFNLIGKKRGLLVSGGEVNAERCAAMLLEEFRSAKIGRITLELP